MPVRPAMTCISLKPPSLSQVDASAACRMNPLTALGIDRSSLMRESLHVHGGMVYSPGIRTLPTEKTYIGERMPDLIYKPEVSLDGRKAANGYVGLYKSPPPGIQKPLVVPGADTLGLDRRVGPVDKPSDLGLNGATSPGFLRLPWASPYETGLYPFLDSSKFAALSMYKASFMSQPSPYLPQHLAYQSLCAGAGGSAAGAERLFYMPPYTPTPISAPLPPPLRIPTATVAPTTLSPLVHHQDKSLQSMGPRIHHEASAFGQQHHVSQSHHSGQSERQHGASKSSRTPSNKNSSSSSSTSNNVISSASTTSTSISSDSSHSLLIQASRTNSRPPQPPGALPPLVDSTSDVQKSVFRSPPSSVSSSSSPAVSHPFYISQENRSPMRPSSQKSKTKEGSSDPHKGDRKTCSSPNKNSSEKPAQTKDPADKPLDLSGKILELEGPTDGFSPKMDALANLGYSPSSRYGLASSREHLKETLSPSSSGVSTSSKTPERPEIISTLHSTWVVPSTSTAQTLVSESNHNKASSVIKNKNLEHVILQQRSSSCPRIGEPNSTAVPNPAPVVVAPACRPSSASPSPKVNSEWAKSSPTPPEKVQSANRGARTSAPKPTKTPKKTDTTEMGFKPQQTHLENGHPSAHLYMTQGETYLPANLAYANRYLPYSVSESMSLPHLQLPGKAPVYPHPVLLSSNSLYSARLPHKTGLPYGIGPSHADYVTYHESQEMVHPLLSPHQVNERLEMRSRAQEKSWPCEGSPYKHTTNTVNANSRHIVEKDEIVCIDLAQDEPDVGPEPDKYKPREPSKPTGSGTVDDLKAKEPELMQILRSSQPAEPKPDPRSVPESPVPSPGEESSREHSPLPPLLEEQTLRCARTSGDRVRSDAAGYKHDRHHAIRRYMDLGVERPENSESLDDEDDGNSKSKRSGLAKRIANSSGYVGDRFKCVTTELYADSSKLSREQRALQVSRTKSTRKYYVSYITVYSVE